MAFNNIVSRSDAQSLIPEVVSDQLLGDVANQSAALTLFPQVRMSTAQTRMPVISALPTAYFVTGDSGLKQTTEVNWANKYLNVEEIAAIVPVPDAVVEDVQFNVWDAARPLLAQAIARTLDAAIFFGTNKPGSWPNDIVTDAVAAGNTVTRGTNAAAAGGIVGDFSDLFATVEADGFDVNGIVASTTYKGLLRQARATTGESLLNLGEANQNAVFGVDMAYPMRGLWPAAGAGAAEAIAGDYTNGILGIRRDITFDFSNEAVIQDNTGAIIYNSFQQDLTLMRVTFRAAFQVANTIRYDNQNGSTRYPFAVLRHA